MNRAAPAGWYADPGEPGQLRWWDGSAWAAGTVAPDASAAVTTVTAPPPASSASSTEEPVTSPVRTSTVWIWLAIAASVLPLFSGVLFDTVTAARFLGYLAFGPTLELGVGGWATAGLVLLIVVDALLVAVAVLFSWLDHRSLRRRGVERPFSWGWAALAFVATLGPYVVGRTVVVRARTGRGTAPLWVWAAATVIGVVVFLAWLTVFADGLWTAVTTSR